MENLETFIQNLIDNYGEFTRGDLQAVVEARCIRTGESSDAILQEIDEGVKMMNELINELEKLEKQEFFIEMADHLSDNDYRLLHEIHDKKQAIKTELKNKYNKVI